MAVWDSARPRSQEPYSHPWLADVLFALDGRLQRRYAVFEYTGNPVCIFRVDIACSPERLALRDGTRDDQAAHSGGYAKKYNRGSGCRVSHELALSHRPHRSPQASMTRAAPREL